MKTHCPMNGMHCAGQAGRLLELIELLPAQAGQHPSAQPRTRQERRAHVPRVKQRQQAHDHKYGRHNQQDHNSPALVDVALGPQQLVCPGSACGSRRRAVEHCVRSEAAASDNEWHQAAAHLLAAAGRTGGHMERRACTCGWAWIGMPSMPHCLWIMWGGAGWL